MLKGKKHIFKQTWFSKKIVFIYAQLIVEYSINEFYFQMNTYFLELFIALFFWLYLHKYSRRNSYSNSAKRFIGFRLFSGFYPGWVILFFPHFWLTWWSLQWMCPNGEIPVNCQKFTRAFRINLLSRNNCTGLIQLSQKLGGNI